MTAHICYCCHVVRGCEGCCAKCKHECSLKHDCELRDCRMTENEGWEWFRSVTMVFSHDYVKRFVPKGILRKIEPYLGKSIELKFDFTT